MSEVPRLGDPLQGHRIQYSRKLGVTVAWRKQRPITTAEIPSFIFGEGRGGDEEGMRRG
jgi:hypothetical protein